MGFLKRTLKFGLESTPVMLVSLFVITMVLVGSWQFFASYKSHLRLQYLDSKKQEFTLMVAREAQELAKAMARMGNRWGRFTGLEYRLWHMDVESYQKDYPFLKMLAWVHESGQVRWINPLPDNGDDIRQTDVMELQAVQQLNAESRELGATRFSGRLLLPDPQGNQMLVSSPLYDDELFRGWLVALVNNEDYFRFLKLPADSQDLQVQVVQSDGMPLYGDGKLMGRGIVSTRLDVYGQSWELRMTPAVSLDNRLNLWQVDVFYGFLLLLFVTLGTLLRFAIVRSKDARVLSATLLTQETVMDALVDGLILVDRNGFMRRVNRATLEMFGYQESEMLGSNVKMLMPEPYQSKHDGYIRRFLTTGRTHILDSRRQAEGQRKDRSIFPIELLIRQMRIEGEQLFVGVIRDISEQAQTNKALESERSRLFQTESLLKSAIRSSNVGFAIQTLNGSFTEVNDAFAMLFGYPPAAMAGLDFAQITPPDEWHNVELQLNRLATGEVYSFTDEVRFLHRDGKVFWGLLSASRVLNEQGEAVFLAAQIVDIDQEKRLALQLEVRALELERSNQDLDRFAYIASHDLKSPLRGISQLASWIEEDIAGQASEETREYLAKMRNRVVRMEKLLDDLLTYSRVGKREESVCTVIVEDMVKSTFELLAPPAHFTLRIGSVLPIFETHSTPLQLVLRNLLSNSIKHFEGELGLITVSCQVKRGYYEFCVEDNGPGVPPQFQEKVFEMFQTLKPRDQVEGSGMGLALVRKVVQQQGGTVRLDSDGSHGTRVSFTWPR